MIRPGEIFKTMRQSLTFLVCAFAALGVLSTGALLARPAFAQEKPEKGEKDETTAKIGAMTKPVAKISPVKAMRAATAKFGGKAVMASFEFGEGHWGYDVTLVKDGKLTEVEIDPMTGKVGDSESTTPDDAAKELKDTLIKLTTSG